MYLTVKAYMHFHHLPPQACGRGTAGLGLGLLRRLRGLSHEHRCAVGSHVAARRGSVMSPRCAPLSMGLSGDHLSSSALSGCHGVLKLWHLGPCLCILKLPLVVMRSDCAGWWGQSCGHPSAHGRWCTDGPHLEFRTSCVDRKCPIDKRSLPRRAGESITRSWTSLCSDVWCSPRQLGSWMGHRHTAIGKQELHQPPLVWYIFKPVIDLVSMDITYHGY